jgi:hypothetical protein
MEMVEIAFKVVADSGEIDSFHRTARAVGLCVFPRVTDTLGGVTDPRSCDHRHYERLTAGAGPNAGLVCCSACGGAA